MARAIAQENLWRSRRFCQVGHLSMSKDLSVLVPQVTYTNQFTDEKLKFAIQLELPVAVVRQNTQFCQVGHLSMSKDLSVLVPQVTYTNQFTDEKLKFAIQLELPVAVVRQNTQSAQNEVFECYISVEAGASKVSHIKTCDTIKLIHMTSR
ncbi:hypothetical protein OsJ_18484 [Oryza sativa Japonica Group]|uniref:Uncharacterized protein n=1 Tax=Oryza sativa subsp. japonica TaxID=39947 RepID=B9FID0_ORYSJ|nr:hypothetical protein OsJ_18484 [Oryza sativa Japonica Group]